MYVKVAINHRELMTKKSTKSDSIDFIRGIGQTLHSLNNRSDALPATDTHGNQYVTTTGSWQFVHRFNGLNTASSALPALPRRLYTVTSYTLVKPDLILYNSITIE